MDDLTIRPYQADGLEFLVDKKRALLADRPGLGKSMQALLAMRDLVPEPGRVLIVATGDAIGVWQEEVAKWLDEVAWVYAGPRADESILEEDGIAITNYSRLATALEYPWEGVIFDESQMLRNRKTRTLFLTVRAAFDSRRTGLAAIPTFFLSGTPIVKAAGDLWPILHLINRQRWSSYWKFVQRYSIVWQDQFGWHVEGVTNARALWEDLSTVCLRRTEGEVELPPKLQQRVPLDMTPRQERLYRNLETQMMEEVDIPNAEGSTLLLAPTVLALETRLRQALVSPRLLGVNDDGAAIPSLAAVANRSPDPFVVFTPFAQALPILADYLTRKTNRPIYTIHGGMGERFNESVDLFKRAAKAGAAPILASTVQMGKSWSVAEVTHEVYMLGFDWNATTQLQAESRLHRDGQRDTVFARYLTHAGTIDINVLDVLGGKRKLADVILDRARFRRLRPAGRK